ncbi:hypothetical protein ACFY8W_12195 [Streptomyces sp. NPDC012637]|uniref:hypothetical protein n=1 Tax=Streptomyces sp. NPDC012637 TaxID=3364842 RepID=UPI0036E3E72E
MTADSRSYLLLVRTSGWYDLVVTAAFVTPWTYALLHEALALGPLPEGNPVPVLYANLMGSVIVVWSLLRVLRPLPLHGLLDGVARVLFTTWQAYALAHGAPAVVWLFLVVEVTFGVAQLAPWARPDAWRNRPGLRPETP